MITTSSPLFACGTKVLVLMAIAAILFSTNLAIANAQLPSKPAVIENGVFQNPEDGIRLKVPDG